MNLWWLDQSIKAKVYFRDELFEIKRCLNVLLPNPLPFLGSKYMTEVSFNDLSAHL